MQIRKTLFTAFLAAAALTASAQEQPKTEYVFQPHWYIQAQAGAQYTLGELSFSDLISPNGQVAVGYNFSKVLGARLGVGFYQSKAGTESCDYKNQWRAEWKWKYVAPAIDITADLTNLIGGYNPNRVVSVGIFAGIGANIGFSNDEAADAEKMLQTSYGKPSFGEDRYLRYLWDGTKVRLFGRAGGSVDFRVSDVVSLGVEVNANTLNDKYNSKKAGNADWYFNALAGVKINLGKRYTTRTIEPVAPAVVEKVVEKIVEKPVVVEEKREEIRRDIFFTIRATEITLAESTKVKEVAEYMQKYPDSKVTVTGYADKKTGNAKINRDLSIKRANAVADALRLQHGIDAERIKVEAKGDTEQPYAENDLNRVSICIAE